MSEFWDGEERRSDMFNKDFYDKMMEMHTDVKYIAKWIEEHKKDDDEVHTKFDGRIKVLENDRLKVIGGASVLGVVGGFFTKWLMK